tara:strand:+ start:269 stop:484 length:216 start_codon:yes stop_codon:yes gene_type:complete
MSSIDDAIEKLLRRIQRAASKNKWKKVGRLTEQLNQLEALAESMEQQEEYDQQDDEYVHEEEEREAVAHHN